MNSSMPDLSLSRALAPGSRATRAASRRLVRVLSELTSTLGRAPRPNEVALAMHMSDDDYRASLRAVADESSRPVELFGLDVLEGELALAQLPEASRVLLGLHYAERCTFAEIAAVLGITEGRAAELHTEALHLLSAVVFLRRKTPARGTVIALDFGRDSGPRDSQPPGTLPPESA